jgi:hypothetical protein
MGINSKRGRHKGDRIKLIERTFQMLSKFNNEVLSYGPTAVLPQNLNRFWIKKLQKAADEFLDNNFDLHECKDPHDIGDPILSACVYEILAYQSGKHVEVSPGEMAEKLTVYALSIIMEAVQREDAIGLEPPDLDNILSMDRIIAYKKKESELREILKASVYRAKFRKGIPSEYQRKIAVELVTPTLKLRDPR